MAFQSVPNHAEAVIFQAAGTLEVLNVLGFRHDGTYAQVNIDDLAEAVDEWFGTEIMPLLDDDYAYVRTDVRGLTNENDLFGSANAFAATGGVTGTTPPTNVAFCISHRSTMTGRSARGRTFHGGIPDTMFATTNSMLQTWVDDLEAAWATLATYLSGTGWTFVVISRFSAGEKRALGISFTIATSYATDNRVDTQRRRLS